MGLWTKLFGGAEGCREAIRESYQKHVRLTRQKRINASSPHEAGLYGALSTRYIAHGTPVAEVIVWAQLAPFLVMKEAEAVEALAEYVVFQERPRDARVAWLKEAINSALSSCPDPSRTVMATLGIINQVAWCALLEPDTLKVIEDAVEKMQQDSEAQSTSKKNEKASVRAMWRGKSTEVLQPGLKGKAWIEGTQYCFQPDGEDVPVICRREDILSDGPPPVRRPLIDDAGEKMQQDAESQSTSRKNEEDSVRAMWWGKSTGGLRLGVMGKAWIEGTQYCFQPDSEDVSVTCQRDDILSDGPLPARRPQEGQEEKPQKRTITAEQMGIELSAATLQMADNFFQEFEDTGFITQLSSQQEVRLELELLLFELVCKTLSLARFYGEEGYKASSFLARETLTTFAENLQIENVSSYTDAAFVKFNSHYQYYSQDIWELWSAINKGDKKVYDQKAGAAGIGGIGEKILRKILNPVLDIALEKPKINRKAGQDWGDTYKEWGSVPLLKLTLLLFTHVTMSHSALNEFAKKFTLSDSETPSEKS